MIRVLSTSYVLGILLLLAGLESRADAGALLPVYRHVETEERFQAESKLPRAPPPEREMMSMGRALMAARNRDFAALAAAAREIVVHAPTGVAAGWSSAAQAWLALYRISNDYSNDGNHDWDERREAGRVARDALREAAYSFYAAYRSSADPDDSSKALSEFTTVQTIREEYIGAELALLALLKARHDPDAKGRLERIRHEHGFRIREIRIDEDRDVPRACICRRLRKSAAIRRTALVN